MAQSATLDLPKATPKAPKPKPQPPYAVIVLNDNIHTFEYVIICFQKVFKYEMQKCYLLAEEIHNKGRAVVWSGSLEVAELKRDQIVSVGPDFFATPKVETPLGVVLEPMG